jgi:uncharacterized membrane protein
MVPARPDRQLLLLGVMVWVSLAVIVAFIVRFMIRRPARLWRRRDGSRSSFPWLLR